MNSDKNRALKHMGLNKNLPVLLVLGGGTGSEFINRLIIDSLPELSKIVQIIHSLGSRKQKDVQFTNYYPSEFISNMADAYSAADFILSRAGLSTITELSALKKVSIIIPIPNTHQEYNAELLASLNAALVLNQKHLTSKIFPVILRKLIFDFNAQQIFTKNISEIMPKNSDEKIANIILKIIEK